MAQTRETENPPTAAAKLTVSQMWRSCPDNTAPHTGCRGRAFTGSLANSHVTQTHTYMCMQMSIWTNSMGSLTHSLTQSHKSTNIQEQIWKKLVSCSLYCVCFPFEQVPSIPHSVCLWVWEYAHSRKRMETPGTQAHIHCYTAKQSYHCILHDAIKAEPLQDRTCLPSGSLLIIYFLRCFSEPKTVNVTNMLLYVLYISYFCC